MLAVAVSDSAQNSANGSFAITIAAPLQITTTSLPNGSPGISYGATLAASGGFSPYTWSITQGSLPAGLILNASSGLISGTPTVSGPSNFTVQVTDNGAPALSVTANLVITITPAPARSAALYVADGNAYQIASNGSLSYLPSSPEQAFMGPNDTIGSPVIGISPTLPLLFILHFTGTPPNESPALASLLVNPDYSLSIYSTSAPLPGTNCSYAVAPSVDPTSSNVYLPGCVDNNNDPGVLIYPADGQLPLLGMVAVPGGEQNLPGLSKMVFTPDATHAFIASCPGGNGSILSYSRAQNGELTLASTYNLPAGSCAAALSISPDGTYLAEGELLTSVVQVFSIASDGSLTPASQRLVVNFNLQGTPVYVSDLTWGPPGTELILATNSTEPNLMYGGMAVLSYSVYLVEEVYPLGGSIETLASDGSFYYSQSECQRTTCGGVVGFDFQDGQLSPLPGSPYPINTDNTDYGVVVY